MEIIAVSIQLVEVNQNILFTDTVCKGNRWITHRAGSGLVTLKGVRGCDCQPNARYLVTFSGNIAVPEDGTVGEISVGLSIDGEPDGATIMRVTPTAVDSYFNVAASTYIDAPNSCCVRIAVTNTSTQAINVQNANLTVVRVA